jgi:ribonuclease VapC
VSESDVVLDASALLCVLFREPGAEKVERRLEGARISAVNYGEVVAKLLDRGAPATILTDLYELNMRVIDHDRRQAEIAGLLREATRARGLSLGDRACLALAIHADATALTADRTWGLLEVGARVELIR